MANYAYVVDSTFQPFSLQEMLIPFSAYKDSFEKSEEAYNDLSKSDIFKYLDDTLPGDSKARQIYDNYSSELKTQAEDLAHNGLTMGNRRALTSLKRRYQGEIGRLIKADAALDEERKLRRNLNAQDSSRLYATDNLSIDDFLDGNNPNLYSISGNELYTRGAAAGKAASSRVFSAGDEGLTLGGYYRDYVQKLGYNADTMAKFRKDMATIPELQMAADAILEERGANQNLTGYNLQRARQSVINGMIDGAVYQENHNPTRDLGVLTMAEDVADHRAEEQLKIQLATQGFSYNPYSETVTYHPDQDPALQKAKAIADVKASSNKKGGKKGQNGRSGGSNQKNKEMLIIGADTGRIYKSKSDDTVGADLGGLDEARALTDKELSDMIDPYGNIKNAYIRNAINNGDLSDYVIYKIPKGAGESWWPGDHGNKEDAYVITPRKAEKASSDSTDVGYDMNNNDVPK